MSSTKVKVAVRVRPMNKRELDLGTHCVVDMLENQTVLDSISSKRTRKTFAFDHCFWSIDPNNPKFADQELVFKSLGTDVLDNAFAGYNACIFAYGQTGSGKSYTMMGVGGDDHLKGIIPRLCDTLFAKIAENKDQKVSFKVEVSYMEIYCEKVRDLLCPKGGKLVLKLREHKTLGPYVENLSKLAVTSFKDINELMSEGNKSRTVAATQMNTESSRSHAVFSILLSQTHFDPQSKMGTEKVAKISLVDLAGSERVSKTGLVGDRLKEGSNINKSLTTLGLVISALADISGGKKPKGSHIPYRDSTLTWLLKDNLGGNSKTVMVATVSPASDNYEETLSTLRYADRAKRIVNHAVVNEDPNSRIVRELREEVEKLQALLAGKLSGGGNAVSAKEMLELREKLRISEGLFSEMTKSWETKLTEANRIHQERQKALENMGISVQESGIGVQGDKFYLVNLNADPSMNELLVCYLKDVTRIGRASTEVPQDIQLRGLGIANEHCIVEIVGQDVFITPIKAARTLVNGHMASEKVQVRHGARILLGNNHLFRLNCPGGSGGQMDYDEAMKEISSNELKHDPMYVKMKDELIERHKAEKEGALEEQKQKYEEQLAKLKEKLETSNTTSPTPPTKPQPRVTTLEEEWEYRNRERLINTVLAANRLVQEANLLSEALNKDTLFKVTLTVPRSFLCPRQKVDTEEMHTSNEVAIRVLHKQRGTDSVWSLDALEEKVLTMREMYERLEDGGTLLDEELGPDPFYDLEQHALLGVANIFLECLQHECVSHEYEAPIVAPTGKVCGKLRLAIQRVPTMMADLRLEREGGDEVDMSGVLEVVDDGGELQPGSVFTCQVTVIEATGLPREYCHYVFCQYQFWSQEEAMIIPPLVQSVGEKLPDGVQRFDHGQTFTVEVTEDLLEFIQDGALSVEVWGHRRGFDLSIAANEEGEGGRPKSFPERWSELTRRLELWVEIMELSDQGEYVPVEIQTKQDVVTGGIFMIRQGQSRRISVVVQEVEGSGRSPLVCESISSISVGSIYLRNRYDEPLDSCQENDVERLRIKWSEALMNRRDYLDTEVRKLMEKREQSVSDLEKQNKLLDQWAVLQWQRAAVLQPKAGSGVPGAPTNWSVEPGVETSAPVLFLDMNDDLLTPSDDDPVGAVTTGSLFGEKPETMKELPIIKREEHAPRAMASWDSTIYDNNSLNKVTASNDRVYAILKVGVQLKHPPGIELVLRKRICLRVYKAMGIGTKLLRVFTGRESRTACGVMYEVVMGIPKQEGMQPPPKIPANPSFVELDEDENAVEKFKKAMSSISNILALDRLKQEVALKEKLASSGKVLRKRYAYGESPSLSRADSGLVYAGSRAETPEPSDDQSEPALVMSSFPPDEEEATTVGGAATSLQLNHVEEEGGELGPEPRVLEIEVDPVQRLDIIPEGGPALEVIPEEPGQAEDGSLPQTEDGSQPQTEDGSQPQTEDGSQPQTEDGSQPQTEDGSQPQTEDGGQPQTEDGSQPRTEDGGQPRTEDSSLPQTEDGSQPQTEDGSRPGTEDGSLPQTEDSSQPQTEDGSRPGTEDGSLPQTEDSSLPQTEDSSLPQTEDGSQPRTEDGSQPRTEDSSQPRTEDSSQPRTEDSSQPRTEDSSLLVTEQKQPLVASEGQGDISKAPKEDDTEESTRKESSKDERPIDSHEPRPEEPVTGPKEGSMESAGETIPLSKVPEVITTSSEGDIHHETLENQGRTKGRSSLDPRALEDDIVNLRRRSEGDVRVPVKHKPPHSPHSRSTTSSPLMNKKHDTTKRPHSPSHRRDSSPGRVKREPSPPSSGESENSSVVSESAATKVTTSLVVKERVVVDVAGSYKLGTIKYIGVTEFAAGEWVGVALDRPSGKHNGTVKGVKYFSCKDKHGIFVRREKIISTESSVSTPKSRNKSPSPLTGKKYVSNSAAYARPTYASSSKSSYSRRSSLGPGRKA